MFYPPKEVDDLIWLSASGMDEGLALFGDFYVRIRVAECYCYDCTAEMRTEFNNSPYTPPKIDVKITDWER
jgi:hypothetical protein